MNIIGVDEVGRGAWAGPMLVCAVKLNIPIDGLTDSKRLTKKKREEFFAKIIENNPVGFGWVSASEIDDYGLSLALKIAAAKALSEIDTTNCKIIVDGNIQFFGLLINSQTLIKADIKEPAVSAASIVAKVTRDNLMAEYAQKYPKYSFEKHVGYGTAVHSQAIKQYGLTPLHRKSFKIHN